MAEPIDNIVTVECRHCWHGTGGYSNGMGTAGDTDFICCHCDQRKTVAWTSERDPSHGPYSPSRVRVFDPPLET